MGDENGSLSPGASHKDLNLTSDGNQEVDKEMWWDAVMLIALLESIVSIPSTSVGSVVHTPLENFL